MKKYLLLLCVITFPAWCQPTDSTATNDLPPKSNFRSSFIMEGGYAYAFTFLPAIRSFFNENQVKRDGKMDKFVLAGFGYRRHRVKGMIQSFYGIDQSLLPPDQTAGSNLVARRQNLSGLTLLAGYDVANTRNQRVYINAGLGSIRYEYSLFRATNQQVSFQQLLQYAPQASVPSLYVTSGFWEINVEISNREKRRESAQWVSRIGYRRSFQATPWQSDAYQLVDAPNERISQIYFQIGFYFARNYLARQK